MRDEINQRLKGAVHHFKAGASTSTVKGLGAEWVATDLTVDYTRGCIVVTLNPLFEVEPRLTFDMSGPRAAALRDHREFDKNHDLSPETLTAAVWSGEGLPPVGCACELRCQTGGWGPAKIKYISPTQCVWLWTTENPEQVEWAEHPYRMEFRPLRTAEQLAAETREKAIAEMVGLIRGAQSWDDALGMLYDRGVRLPHA